MMATVEDYGIIKGISHNVMVPGTSKPLNILKPFNDFQRFVIFRKILKPFNDFSRFTYFWNYLTMWGDLYRLGKVSMKFLRTTDEIFLAMQRLTR